LRPEPPFVCATGLDGTRSERHPVLAAAAFGAALVLLGTASYFALDWLSYH